MPLEELRELLKKIYVEARRKDKNMYSKSSLIAIRFGLCKFIEFHRPELDIINGSKFKDANLVFKAKIVELKRLGKAKLSTSHLLSVKTSTNSTTVLRLIQKARLGYRIRCGLR